MEHEFDAIVIGAFNRTGEGKIAQRAFGGHTSNFGKAPVIIDAAGKPFEGLYAAGECACVSVHGANRLGCNSLLDTLVFGRRSGIEISRFVKGVDMPQTSPEYAKNEAARISDLMNRNGEEQIGSIMVQLQEVMMEKASVFRMGKGLTEALDKIRELQLKYANISLQDKGRCFNRNLLDALELGHMLDLAEVIAMRALYREESRGAHFREDFQDRNDEKLLAHSMARFTEDVPRIFNKAVVITRFQPKERSIDMKCSFIISRFDPGVDKSSRYQEYIVDAEPTDKIPDCLNTIRWEQDATLAFRSSCAHGICGSDALVINSRVELACQMLVRDFKTSNNFVIEPLIFASPPKQKVFVWISWKSNLTINRH